MSYRRLVLATHNRNKLREIQAILNDLPVEVLDLDAFPEVPEVIEDGKTFEANAEKKAKEVAEATGCLALADDSGLCVDALGGEPGVFSARYAGEEKNSLKNCRKLLEELKNVHEGQRTARFCCAISIAEPGKVIGTVLGECQGVILHEMKGEGGFGYDPLFLYPSLNKTFAELQPEEKNRISHRFQALEKARQFLRELFREETH